MSNRNPFYTITDEHTQYTNSRSARFPTFSEAERAAQERLQMGSSTSVFILKAVAQVKPRVVTDTITVQLDRH